MQLKPCVIPATEITVIKWCYLNCTVKILFLSTMLTDVLRRILKSQWLIKKKKKKERKFSFSVHLTSLCRASTNLNTTFAGFPWGLPIPTLNFGLCVLFSLNTEPGVHRPGIWGAMSQRLRLLPGLQGARQPSHALSVVHCLNKHFKRAVFCYLTHSPSLLYWEQHNTHLIHFIHFINMLSSWSLTQTHWACSPWITSQHFLSSD